ncbi:MAG TPA: ribonuclease H-like domain-containing protein [Dongiaceae bacterium]|nr:ribonuclease H-like domain-containing protein [Dongiaceae bacterium]
MASADKFSRLAALRPVNGMAPREVRTSAPAPALDEHESELARLIGASVARTKFGTHLSVSNWHSTPELPDISAAALDLLCNHGDAVRCRKWRAAAENPEKWLFLDTETTGLAGGTGTYAFLVGIGWWDAGGLQVEQLVMRDFSDEYSLLTELAARIAERPVLVTFNGKSFDWPLLESRYLMTRTIRVPQLAAHLDLLHPARAVWKLRLGSVRLVELERHVLDAPRLGWTREDDVPSSQIPQFYFDYLRGGPATPLAGVVRHNRMDLRGLAALFGKLNSLLGTPHHPDGEGLDLFGLSRYLQRRGQAGRAESACAAARDRGLPEPVDAQALYQLARMAKRRKEFARAAELFTELLEDPQFCAAACEELAIFQQSRNKDPRKALEFARRGLREARRRNPGAMLRTGRTAEFSRMARLEKRIARLEARLAPVDAPLLNRVREAAR